MIALLLHERWLVMSADYTLPASSLPADARPNQTVSLRVSNRRPAALPCSSFFRQPGAEA
jgi:hypothetical protein